jgi:hypothetical protein
MISGISYMFIDYDTQTLIQDHNTDKINDGVLFVKSLESTPVTFIPRFLAAYSAFLIFSPF